MSSTPRKTRGAKSIGHYVLMKTIGEGTFGKVKLGTHILTGERVAVKVLEKERIVDIADVERVAREIHILKLIRHPHIIQLYEIIETPRQLYLIMEYASGGELFDYIVAHGKAQEPEACRFLHQILAGVEKVHAMRVVHRDLKPENLLLDDRKDIKIVDFGLSNTYQESQLLQTACGSPCYAAPEMIAGRRYVPSMVDIWSCGVILFALVCGYLPFEDQNHAELYKKILNAEYEIPNSVSKEVADLISGMLTTDPTRRMNLNDIRQHPWYRQFPEASKKMTDAAGNLAMDEEVLEQLDSYGYQREYAVKCLQTNKHNHVTTTYYLLLEKRLRAANEGKTAAPPLSVADLDGASFEDFNTEVPGATTVPAAVTAAAVAAVATPSRSGGHAEAERCSHSGRRGARPGTWLDADGMLQTDGQMPTMAATGPISSTDPLLASAETPPATARQVPRLNLGGLPQDAAALAAEDSRGKAGHESKRPASGAASASGRSSHSQGAPRRYHGDVHGGATPQSARPRSVWYPSPNTPRERLAFEAGTPRGASAMGRRPLSARAGYAGGYANGGGGGAPMHPPPRRRPSGPDVGRAGPPWGGYRPWSEADEMRAGYGHSVQQPLAGDSHGSHGPPLSARPRLQGNAGGYRDRSAPRAGGWGGQAAMNGGGRPTSARRHPVAVPSSARGTRDRQRSDDGRPSNPGVFHVSCMSSLHPRQIMQEVLRALAAHHLSHRQVSNFLVRCQNQGVRFEAEVLQMERGGGYMLRFSRASGDIWHFKEICDQLLADLLI